MYLSLKGSLGHTAITDRVGESLLQIAEGSSAAYSLRNLGSDSPSVVRVRRESDNAERDFSAQDINTSVVENWVNQQIIPPLDLRELTPTGRDGPLIPAAAAYSLRNLSNSYTGNVVEVRRTSDDQVRSFTAVEVSDGTLLAWVNTDVDITDRLIVPANNGTHYVVTSSTDSSNYTASVNNTAGVPIFSEMRSGLFQEGRYKLTGTIEVTGLTGQILIQTNGGDASALVNTALTEGTNNLDFEFDVIGDGSTTAAGVTRLYWYSEIGASATSIVSSNLTWQVISADGHVSTWYDQSGNTKHATQGTPASQPKVVDAGILVAGGIDFDGVDDYFDLDLGADLAQPNSFFMVHESDTLNFDTNEFFDATGASPRTLIDSTVGAYRLAAPTDFTSTLTIDLAQKTVVGAFANSTSSFLSKNGEISATYDAGTDGVNQFSRIGRSQTRYYDGKMDEFIIYNSDQSDNRTAFEANIGEVYGIAGIPAYDNTVNGFVETWYDQSGNGNNASQSTASNQPKIVDAGVLVLSNGDAAIKSTASTGLNFSMASLSADGQQSVFGVLENDVTSQDNFSSVVSALSSSTSTNGVNRRPYWFIAPDGRLVFSVDSDSGYTTANRERRLYSHIMEDTAGGTSTIYQDGTQVDTRSITLDANPNFILAQVGVVGTNAVGALYTSEVIYYPSDESAKRAAIEDNIDNHYGITSAGSYVNAAGDSYINAAGDTYLQP